MRTINLSTVLARFGTRAGKLAPHRWLVCANTVRTVDARFRVANGGAEVESWIQAFSDALAHAGNPDAPIDLLLDASIAPVLVADRKGMSPFRSDAFDSLFDDIFDARPIDVNEPHTGYAVRSTPFSPDQALACAIPQALQNALQCFAREQCGRRLRARPALCAAYDWTVLPVAVRDNARLPNWRLVATDESLYWLLETPQRVVLHGPASRSAGSISQVRAAFQGYEPDARVTAIDLAVSGETANLFDPISLAGEAHGKHPLIVHRPFSVPLRERQAALA